MLSERSKILGLKNYLIFFGLILFNLLLKMVHLGSEPFWYDESISIKASLLDFGHVKHMAEWDNNPPFYYYCLWVWLKLTGISEFNARLLSVIFSAISAGLLFIFTRRYFNFSTAIWSVLLFSFHNLLFQYTHEARCYSLTVMLALISSILFFRLIEKPTYVTAIWLGILNFLLIYTHYLTGILLFIQFVLILIYKFKPIRVYMISVLAIIILVVVRFTKKQVLHIFSYHSSEESFWLQKADLNSLRDATSSLFGSGFLFIILIICLIIGIIQFFRNKSYLELNSRRILSYSFLSSIGTILVLFLIGTQTAVFLDRYLLFTIPFFIIFICWSLCSFNKWMQLILLLIVVFQLRELELNPSKPMDFKTAADVIKNINDKNKDMILLQTKDITGLFMYYYDRDVFIDQNNFNKRLVSENVFDINSFEDVSKIDFNSVNTFVFCQCFDKEADNLKIMEYFRLKNFHGSFAKGIKGVKVSVWKKS